MANKHNSVLYTGVTSSLKERVERHKLKKYPESFSARYSTSKLVYYEMHDTMGEAIRREKLIKGGSRKKKIDLINTRNPDWVDLSDNVEGK